MFHPKPFISRGTTGFDGFWVLGFGVWGLGKLIPSLRPSAALQMAYVLRGGAVSIRLNVPWDDDMHLHALQHAVGGAVLLPVNLCGYNLRLFM